MYTSNYVFTKMIRCKRAEVFSDFTLYIKKLIAGKKRFNNFHSYSMVLAHTPHIKRKSAAFIDHLKFQQ